jgi:hypothetical protein
MKTALLQPFRKDSKDCLSSHLRNWLFLSFTPVFLLLAFFGCSPSSNPVTASGKYAQFSDDTAAPVKIPISEIPEDTTGWLPDDIVYAPGGAQYRANCIQADSIASTPEGTIAFLNGKQVSTADQILTADVTLVNSLDTFNIFYRDFIKTSPGTKRNNIFTISRSGSLQNSDKMIHDVVIASPVLPDGFSFTQAGNSSYPMWAKAIVVINISREVSPGFYPIPFTISIDGKTFGAVHCLIQVTPQPCSVRNDRW